MLTVFSTAISRLNLIADVLSADRMSLFRKYVRSPTARLVNIVLVYSRIVMENATSHRNRMLAQILIFNYFNRYYCAFR